MRILIENQLAKKKNTHTPNDETGILEKRDASGGGMHESHNSKNEIDRKTTTKNMSMTVKKKRKKEKNRCSTEWKTYIYIIKSAVANKTSKLPFLLQP